MKARPPEIPDLDTRWMAEAACARIPGLPWIENLNQVPRVLVRIMADTCRTCPVLDTCTAFVRDTEVTAGYWAGANRSARLYVEFKKPTPVGADTGDEAA